MCNEFYRILFFLRIIQRFFDMGEAEEFKNRFKDIRDKIQSDTATKDELLEVVNDKDKF